MRVPEIPGKVERLAFLFRVLEIRQVLEKVPQRLLPQRAREFLPASGLGLVAPAERRKRGNPQIGELGGALRRIRLNLPDDGISFSGPAGIEQPPRYAGIVA